MGTSILCLGVVSWLVLTAICSVECSINGTHVGCFSSSDLVEFRTEISPITWDICMYLCRNKVTQYAGVQAGLKPACYCGNNIDQYSTPKESSSCHPCYDDQERQCGGNDALSLYRLTDEENEALLIATSRGVEMLLKPNVSLPFLNTTNLDVTGVAYHFKNNHIFVASGKQISKYCYVPVLKHYIHPAKLVELSSYIVMSMDVDWVNNGLYYAHSGSSSVVKVDLDRSNLRNTSANGYTLKKVVSDPVTGDVFSLDSNVYVGHLYGNLSTATNILIKFGSFYTYQIALDTHNQLLYVIGKFSSYATFYLACVDYEATSFRIIYGGPEVNPSSTSYIRALEVFNDKLYWAIRRGGGDEIVYSAKIKPSGQIVDLKIIYSTYVTIRDLKVYHVEKQTYSTKTLCLRKACSHTCSVVTRSKVICLCPPDQVLSDDGKTCADPVWPNVASTSQSPSSQNIPSSTQDVPSSTEDSPSPQNPSSLQVGDIFTAVIFVMLVVSIAYIVVQARKRKAHPHLTRQPTNCSEENVYEEMRPVPKI